MQNGYGAVWNDQNEDWLTPEIHAHLWKTNNTTKQYFTLVLTVERRIDYDKRLDSMNNKPSPLD